MGTPVSHLFRGAPLGHGDIGGQGGATEGAQINGGNLVFHHAEGTADSLGRRQFPRVPLPVAEGQGVTGKNPVGGAMTSAVAESRPPLNKMIALLEVVIGYEFQVTRCKFQVVRIKLFRFAAACNLQPGT
jgi:hypothetical protein